MKIAKPILLVATPIGIIGGLYEGYRLAGGLVFLMAALLALISAAVGMVVLTIRQERAEERASQAAAAQNPKPGRRTGSGESGGDERVDIDTSKKINGGWDGMSP